MSETARTAAKGGDARVIGATGGAVGLGAVAAVLGTCCVAPWAVSLIGVAGAVALARLTVFAPFLIAGSIALSAVAFYFAYRPLPVCADDACETTSRRRLRRIAWAGACIVTATLAISVAPYL
jgi:hypothetical protein